VGTRWVQKWEIQGSRGDIYTVARDADGNFGCSCPVWKFKREECKHIRQVKDMLRNEAGPQEGPVLPKKTRKRRSKPVVPIDWGGENNVWF
jgi:hypothetical protein